METESKYQKKLAVLIDADNASPKIIEGLVAEIANYGIASIKRIYGDWTNPKLSGWKEHLINFAIQPIQQFGYTVGKNSTDSAMIIDAMDLLYTEKLDGFCIVSSDSDFTRLSSRIREAGLLVFGFGEQKTPKAFVVACDKFIYTEILAKSDVEYTTTRKSTRELRKNNKLVKLILNAVEDSADDHGWSHLGGVGQNINNRAPEFDPRSYGYKKLGELIKAIDIFDISEKASKNSPAKAIYVKYNPSKHKSNRR